MKTCRYQNNPGDVLTLPDVIVLLQPPETIFPNTLLKERSGEAKKRILYFERILSNTFAASPMERVYSAQQEGYIGELEPELAVNKIAT